MKKLNLKADNKESFKVKGKTKTLYLSLKYCEWNIAFKYYSTVTLKIHDKHYNFSNYLINAKEFKFCPFCGRRIKVVR